ncbi:MAG: dethiobiotin synthase [Acidimicrobiia bacterium]|nr:dethiobiotin synthase [Acidimicrobiia bacterium]
MDVFLAAANTDMGKTVVTAAIAAACDGDVAVVKPVQTGWPPDDDAAWVASVSGATPHVLERFEARAGPATCARLEGRDLRLDDLVRRVEAVRADVRLCEPAGGFLSPLNEVASMADLAVALGWRVVISARPDLGTLGLTALVVEAVESRGLDLAGIVVSGYTGTFPEDDNLDRLGRIAPVLGVIPRLDDLTAVGTATRWTRKPPW